ncbi:hypothetical protein AWJ20_2883 [Sugiyamaella lignohabitans]|uniref:Uncharacterized protein n=1 Tax=Sugiyamaella lignohabitans TaxID=796027 RepID=A0A161HMU4_9ASCO|nr:uncharacterized protein AWJ20_2883 [Sugiyamaella lignohabitans]ANB15257.1 hypothetical protein AWJ20_2883 [Sugiyamaella lignohabitans]
MATEIQNFSNRDTHVSIPTSHLPKNVFLDNIPSFSHQMLFASAGITAGLASLPIEAISRRISNPEFKVSTFAKQHTLPHLSRMFVRFWTFDITYSETQKMPIPIWMKASLAGASGGFTELATYSLLYERQKPSLQLVKNLANYSSRMLIGFATFSYLATRKGDPFPPKPFWYCWCLGATAGGVASSVMGAVEGFRGRNLASHVFKSMFLIGTVISVQVTSATELIALL